MTDELLLLFLQVHAFSGGFGLCFEYPGLVVAREHSCVSVICKGIAGGVMVTVVWEERSVSSYFLPFFFFSSLFSWEVG